MADPVRHAGALRERLDFQQRALDDNDARLGEWTTQWSTRAAILYLHGGEPVLAQRLQGEQPAIITIRFNQAARLIDNGWRIVDARDATRVFNITSFEATPRHDWIDILATQQVGQVDNG